MCLSDLFKISPDWNGKTSSLRKTWQSIGNIDQFRWLSRADVLGHLCMARDELGVRYVRAAAMYSPELRVWEYALLDWRKPLAEKSRRVNWQMVDITLEALMDLGLKPIYTTCFTPLTMTEDPAVCWPDKNPVGMPQDLAQWQEFVAEGVRHHVTRYGLEEVSSWYFECWNEPNLDGFFHATKKDFFQLWSATWRAVKSVNPSLRFGGPSTARGEWMGDFLDFTQEDGTPPDYLISHIYNNDSESSPLSPFDGPAADRVKDSPHFATGVIRGLRKELDHRGWTGEVHWNEWGRSWFPQDALKETALDASFVVKTMAEVSQDASAFAFWCLSDIYDQVGFQSSEFEGNYGMLSLHGLRKPSWMAHMLLNRLGESRISVKGGDELMGCIATREANHAVALVYAYPLKYTPEVARRTVEVEWPFGLPTLTRLGAKENNIIEVWRELGSPAYPTPAELKVLRARNFLQRAPEGSVRLEQRPSGPVAIFEMECPGVALLEATPF